MDVKINDYYNFFWRRFKRSFKNYFLLISIGVFLHSVFEGWNKTVWMIYITLLVIGCIYCILITRTVLYKVTFSEKNREVEIQVLRYSTIRFTYVVKGDDFKVTIRRNFWSRYQPWVLKLYQQHRILYKQEEMFGWSYDNFLKIKQMTNLLK